MAKKLSKLAQLKEDLHNMERDKEYYREKYFSSQKKLEDIKEKERTQVSMDTAFRQTRRELYEEENTWLRSLLELITVSSDKLKRLDELREERLQTQHNNPIRY